MSKTTQRIVTALGAALLLSAVPGDAAQAQGWQQYSVPFSCGSASDGDPVLAGSYATAVNLHNPTSTEVMLMSSVSLTFPPDLQEPGETSELLIQILPAHSAIRIDCEAIKTGYIFPPGSPSLDPYAQGFVMINANATLAVSATQTASGDSGDPSVDVEEITARRANPRHKMDVCHRGRTLNISANAVPAHLRHGDTLGACP
jgi:hypothetical protein